MRPYHKEERNLLLACSLFPGRDWKQFFQEKKRKAAVWKHKNNKTYFNHTSDSRMPVEPGKRTRTCSTYLPLHLRGNTVTGKQHGLHFYNISFQNAGQNGKNTDYILIDNYLPFRFLHHGVALKPTLTTA